MWIENKVNNNDEFRLRGRTELDYYQLRYAATSPCEQYWEDDTNDDSDNFPDDYDYPDEPCSYHITIEYSGKFQTTVRTCDISPYVSFQELVEEAFEFNEIQYNPTRHLIHCEQYPVAFSLDDLATDISEDITLICETKRGASSSHYPPFHPYFTHRPITAAAAA